MTLKKPICSVTECCTNCVKVIRLKPDLPNQWLWALFAPPLDGYNRLTVHVCTIAKSSTICFYRGFFLQPTWHPWVLQWSVSGSILPGQADSWQEITTWLASETGHAIWAYNYLVTEPPPLHGYPLPPPSTHIGVLVVLTILWNKLSKMVGNSINYSLKTWYSGLSWVTVDLWRIACKQFHAFLRYSELNILKL